MMHISHIFSKTLNSATNVPQIIATTYRIVILAAPIYPTIDSLIDPLIDLPTYCLMTNLTCNNCYYLKLQTIIKVSNKIDNQLNVIIYNISNILVSSQISERVPVMEE